jgi:hypothetical protein
VAARNHRAERRQLVERWRNGTTPSYSTRKVGAEAVIGIEFHHDEPGEEPSHLSGIAVRCHDLIKGRQYDVLGRIEVPGKMGDEDGAEQPTRVWGTAIRFR